MKGTEIGTRAGCAPLPPDISQGPHQVERAPLARVSRPEQRIPPTRSVEEKRSKTEDRGLGAWRCVVFVWTCRALGQAVCTSYKHTQRASDTPEAKFGPGVRTRSCSVNNLSPTHPTLIPRWAIEVGDYG